MDGFLSGVSGLIYLAFASSSGLMLGLPPAPEDPVIARAAPQQCVFWVSWSGMAAPDPTSTNQTEQLLAEPEVQHFVAQLEKCMRGMAPDFASAEDTAATVFDPYIRPAPKKANAASDATVNLVKAWLTHPASLFVSDLKITKDILSVRGGIVVSLGDDAPKFKESLETILKGLKADTAKIVETVVIGGEQWHRAKLSAEQQPFVWGFHGACFVVGYGDGSVEAILARMDDKEPPAWLNKARRQVRVDRPAAMTYLNIGLLRETMLSLSKTPEAKAVVESLGLDNVNSLVTVTGLEGDCFVSRTLLAVDGEARGLVRLVSDRPLTPEDLAPIPRDATLALAVRLDVQQVVDVILSAAEKMGPEAKAATNQAFEQVERGLGFDLRHNLFRALGDVWCVYNSPGEGGLVLTGLTAVVPVRDRSDAAFSAAYSKLTEMAKTVKQNAADGQIPSGLVNWNLRRCSFAGREIYYAHGDVFAPAWCLTEREFIVALSPQNVKAYLSRRSEYRSLATVPEVSGVLSPSGGPMMVSYCDTPRLFELIYPLVSLVASQFLAATGQPPESGQPEFDVSMLPSAPAIGRHLRPGVTTIRRTNDGIESCSRASLPGGVVKAYTMTMLFGLMPMYIGDRVRRTQENVVPPPPPTAPAAPAANPATQEPRSP